MVRLSVVIAASLLLLGCGDDTDRPLPGTRGRTLPRVPFDPGSRPNGAQTPGGAVAASNLCAAGGGEVQVQAENVYGETDYFSDLAAIFGPGVVARAPLETMAEDDIWLETYEFAGIFELGYASPIFFAIEDVDTDYDNCGYCLYLTLADGRTLMASAGNVMLSQFELGARFEAFMTDLLFTEIDDSGQRVAGGCQLTVAEYTLRSAIPGDGALAQTLPPTATQRVPLPIPPLDPQ